MFSPLTKTSTNNKGRKQWGRGGRPAQTPQGCPEAAVCPRTPLSLVGDAGYF